MKEMYKPARMVSTMKIAMSLRINSVYELLNHRFICVEIRLQNHDCREFIHMTGALLTRDAHFNPCCACILCAEGFIPQDNGDLCLLFQRLTKLRGAPSCQIRVAFFIIRLADHD